MEFEQNHDLFILLAYDILYSVNLNQLKPKSKKSNKEAKLALVFSHSTHTQPEDRSDYPIGMGLFVHRSKLHFFGGQNLENCSPLDHDDFDLDIGLLNKHPIRCMNSNWLNKKVFSFNPVLNNQPTLVPHTLPRRYVNQDGPILNKQLLITRDNSTTPLPNHFGYKVRPIVATISNKVYALATKTYSVSLPDAIEAGLEVGLDKKISLFEVFEPTNGEGEGKWRVLDNPPYPLYEAILTEYFRKLTYCVIKDKLLLQTYYGQYIFDTIEEKWESTGVPYPLVDEKERQRKGLPLPQMRPQINTKTGEICPIILASLEYEGHLLVFFEWMYSYELAAYDLASFGNFGRFGDSWEFGEEAYQSILSIDDIDEENKNSSLDVQAASFSLVENNCICLVFNRMLMLNVYLLEVNTKATKAIEINTKAITATVKAHQKFHLPGELGSDTSTLSTFIFSHDPREKNVGKSYQGESKSVFLRNLPPTMTTFDILQLFELLKFGEIKPDRVILNCKEHFAIVEFEDVESLDKAIKASPIPYAGKDLYIEKMDKKRPFSLVEQ